MLSFTRTFFIILFLVASNATTVYGQFVCSDLFKAKPYHGLLDPIKQLFIWEQTSNLPRFEKPTQRVNLPYVRIKPTDTEITTLDFTPGFLKKYFNQTTFTRWLQHPLNGSDLVPYQDENAAGIKKAFYSASRSMFTFIKDGLFSVKMPTDRPHPNGRSQPEKADLDSDTILSMRRSKHVREVDATYGRAKELYVLTEVISVASKKGNSFSLRDLRPLQDGNYYLPAFSIPYAGREIARINHAEFGEFWQKHYGELLGQAKAQLLLRYGLQMETPNAQNWLIQLDKNLKPTGRIYMRDVADASYVVTVAPYVGAADQLKADADSNSIVMKELEPFWKNSVWQMSEGGVTALERDLWGQAHDKAYIDTIVSTLKLQGDYNSIIQVDIALTTPEGVEALKNYQRHRAKKVK